MSEKRPLSLAFPRGETLPVWAFAFSGIIATLLGVSTIAMMTSTYELMVDYFGITITVGFFAFAFSYIHSLHDRRLFFLSLGAGVLIMTLFLWLNLFAARYAAEYFFVTIQRDAFRFLPGGGEMIVENGFGMTVFLSLLGILPSFLCTWVLIRRKHVAIAILGYVPFIVCTVALNYRTPSQGACFAAICGVLLLLVYQNARSNAKEKTYRDFLILILPVLILLLILGAINPERKYKRDEDAQKQYLAMQNVIEKIQHVFRGFGTGSKIEDEVVKQVEKTYSGSIIIEDATHNILRMSVGKENLLMAGNFNPPKIRFMSVTRMNNEMYAVPEAETSPYLYIKTASMARFDGYSWAAAASDLMVSDYYPASKITDQEAQYVLRVRVDFPGEVAFVPYYTDHYKLDPGSPQYVGEPYLTVRDSSIINEKTALADGSQDYLFAYSEVPVRMAPIWTDEYIAQIYRDCLYVPEETSTGVMRSELLPDWYLALLTGQTDWPVERQVREVCKFVRELHPYDADTRYPPDGMDFVSWFMRNSQTGFCVHYASTAVVLLRMLGIPTRYVSGYFLTDVRDGVSHDVFTTDAHAWIEYFHPDYGWIMDDPTPGNEEAASYFNMNAVKRVYGTDMSAVTPVPRATGTPTPTPYFGPGPEGAAKTGPSETEEAFFGQRFLTRLGRNTVVFCFRILIAALLLALVIVLLRGGYRFYWEKRFSSEDTNSRARAYFRYFSQMGKILACEPSEKGTAIAEKATFSRNGIGADELTSMISLEQKNLTEKSGKAKDLRRYLYRIFSVPIEGQVERPGDGPSDGSGEKKDS